MMMNWAHVINVSHKVKERHGNILVQNTLDKKKKSWLKAASNFI